MLIHPLRTLLLIDRNVAVRGGEDDDGHRRFVGVNLRLFCGDFVPLSIGIFEGIRASQIELEQISKLMLQQ